MKKHRVPKLLHGVVSTYLMQNFPLASAKVFITVTEVNVSPDGAMAKVFLSFMPLGDATDNREKQVKAVMEMIESEKPSLKKYVSQHLGKKLRRIPSLYFERDQSALKASQVSQILAKWSDEST